MARPARARQSARRLNDRQYARAAAGRVAYPRVSGRLASPGAAGRGRAGRAGAQVLVCVHCVPQQQPSPTARAAVSLTGDNRLPSVEFLILVACFYSSLNCCQPAARLPSLCAAPSLVATPSRAGAVYGAVAAPHHAPPTRWLAGWRARPEGPEARRPTRRRKGPSPARPGQARVACAVYACVPINNMARPAPSAWGWQGRGAARGPRGSDCRCLAGGHHAAGPAPPPRGSVHDPGRAGGLTEASPGLTPPPCWRRGSARLRGLLK